MFCRNCGNQLLDTVKFCTECGTKISVAAAPPCEPCSEPEPTATPEIIQVVLSDNTDTQTPSPVEAEPVTVEANVSNSSTTEFPANKPKNGNDFCFCEKCRMILKPNTEICPVCGSWVGDSSKKPGADIIYCPNCWNTVNPGQKFCTNCGATITEQSNTSPAAIRNNQKASKPRFSIPIPISIRYSSAFMKLEELVDVVVQKLHRFQLPLSIRYSTVFLKLEELFSVISGFMQRLPHKKAILAGALTLVVLVSGIAVFSSPKDSNSGNSSTSGSKTTFETTYTFLGNKITSAQALKYLKEMPLGKYWDVDAYSLFRPIGLSYWEVISINDNEIRGSVSGNGMTFYVVLTESYYEIYAVQMGNDRYTDYMIELVSGSLLDSAYEACKAGYYG